MEHQPRKVLLVEPNYKNKYPPIGLMKIASYHRTLGDEVVFYKGEFKQFILQEIYEEIVKKFYRIEPKAEWYKLKESIYKYISRGLTAEFDKIAGYSDNGLILENLKYYRKFYLTKEFIKKPKWDRICISTLFTFHWDKTIRTINDFKQLCKSSDQVMVGGVAASVMPRIMEEQTGIKPYEGLLDKPGVFDANDIIIDTLPLDYSILEEIDCKYPENGGYYGYTTRGCINNCSFCVVPTIEPQYNEYVNIKKNIEQVRNKFGEKRNLLLLDNNVLASSKFDTIVDDIRSAGFDGETPFIEPNKYEVAVNGLNSGLNDRAYKKSIVNCCKWLFGKLKGEKKQEAYKILAEHKLLDEITVTKEGVLATYEFFYPLFEEARSKRPKLRYVDFNQGLEAKLLTNEKMAKLAELPIRPLRIAFDHWELRNTYRDAIRVAAAHGIVHMSNYLLYNYKDRPLDLYNRLKMNIDLCEELEINIYSFPMKYHPIDDPEYFSNRTFLGEHWNRKYIRAIQAILNSTKGKVGRGREFFEEAFGGNEDEFRKLLYMPEVMIIHRMHFKKSGITNEWWDAYTSLTDMQRAQVNEIIHTNDFSTIDASSFDEESMKVLSYYKIERKDVENK